MLHADLTLRLHTHQAADGACFLFTAYTCCMQVLPLLLRSCVAGGPPTLMAHGIAFAIVDLSRNGTAYPPFLFMLMCTH